MKNLLFAVTMGFLISSASAAVYEVSVSGPGGHSNGSYGNTNAVHAGSRMIMELEKSLPCAVVTDFRGGATVNAIAADTHFLIHTQMCKTPEADNLKAIEKALTNGRDKENQFRRVEAGDMVRGFPADIKFFVKVRLQ